MENSKKRKEKNYGKEEGRVANVEERGHLWNSDGDLKKKQVNYLKVVVV